MLGIKFCSQYCQVDHNSALHNDFAEKRLVMAKTWFYKLFEDIIAKEAKNPKYDIKVCITQYNKYVYRKQIYYILSHLHFLEFDLSCCISRDSFCMLLRNGNLCL